MQSKRRTDGTFAPGTSGNPSGRRHDGYVNAFMGHGTTRDRRTYTRHQTAHVNDVQAIDLRRGNWLAARICELRDADAYRRAYELKLEDKDTAENVMAAIEGLGLNKKAMEAGQTEMTCGGAALFPVLDGALGKLEDPLELKEGEPSKIGKVLAIHLLEPRELTPVAWYTDINHPKFRRPERYRLTPLTSGMAGAVISQVEIHESRLAIYPGKRITEQPLPGQRLGWGDSALNAVHETLSDFGVSWGSAATILHNFTQRVFKYKGLMDTLREEGGEALIQKRVATTDMVANALRALILDGDDDFISVSTSVSGLAEMLIQFAQVISAAADIPMTRLFGMSPAGLNATGEYDAEGWYERVGIRQDDHTHTVEWLIRLLLLSADGPTNGQEPDVWSIEWRPLAEPSEKEDAETRKLTAETDKIYWEIGAPAEDILRSRFDGDTYSRETTIDWNAYEKQKKIDDENAAALDKAALTAMGREPTKPNGEPKPNGQPKPEPEA